jgi:hypothetical protein
MDEIIQKLKDYYNDNTIYFEKLNEFSNLAQEVYLDDSGDEQTLEAYNANYKALVNKIVKEMGMQTKMRFSATDYAFDIEDAEGENAVKVAYMDNKLDLYEL